jgi:hypothetical protein
MHGRAMQIIALWVVGSSAKRLGTVGGAGGAAPLGEGTDGRRAVPRGGKTDVPGTPGREDVPGPAVRPGGGDARRSCQGISAPRGAGTAVGSRPAAAWPSGKDGPALERWSAAGGVG